MIGDASTASSFVLFYRSYAGLFSMQLNNRIINEKFREFFKTQRSHMSENINTTNIFADETQITVCNNQKLSYD